MINLFLPECSKSQQTVSSKFLMSFLFLLIVSGLTSSPLANAVNCVCKRDSFQPLLYTSHQTTSVASHPSLCFPLCLYCLLQPRVYFPPGNHIAPSESNKIISVPDHYLPMISHHSWNKLNMLGKCRRSHTIWALDTSPRSPSNTLPLACLPEPSY